MSNLLASGAMDYLAVLLRFLHIITAIALGGAVMFQWAVLRPVLGVAAPEARPAIDTAVTARWRSTVYSSIFFLLATGLINFLMYRVPYFREHPQKAIYHGIFGVKLLAALLFFHGVTVLSLPGAKGDKYRLRAGGWLGYLIALLIVIVASAAVLRYFENLWPWPGH